MTRLTFEKSVRSFAAVGAIAVVVTSITVSTPALAKERPVVVAANPEVVTRRVTYADLNLASLPGEAALNRRVGSAVKSLCIEVTGGSILYMRSIPRIASAAHPRGTRLVLRLAEPSIVRVILPRSARRRSLRSASQSDFRSSASPAALSVAPGNGGHLGPSDRRLMMERLTSHRPQHFTAFHSAAEESARALAIDEWANEGGHMHAMSGSIVATPDAVQPYKVIFDHGDGLDTEEACGTVRECQARIRRCTKIPFYRSVFAEERPFAL